MSSNSYNTCERDPFKGLYTEFAISLPLCITFQLILIGNFIFYNFKHTIKKDTDKPTDNRIHFLLNLTYIIIQILALIFTITELFRFIIDPKILLSETNAKLCDMFAYCPQLIIIIFYGCYTLHIVFRIEISLKEYLSLHQYTVISLLFVAIISFSIPIILFITSQTQTEPNTCIWKWIPLDINDSLSICAFQSNTYIIISLCYAIFINIIFCIIFTIKIKQLFLPTPNKQNTIKNIDTLKLLLTKYSILCFIGCICIIFTAILYLILFPIINMGTLLLYFDIYLHCLILTLMYNCNNNYYNKCCNKCITHFNKIIESKQLEISNTQTHIKVEMTSPLPIDSPTPNTKTTATNGTQIVYENKSENIETKTPDIVHETKLIKPMGKMDISVENIDSENEKSKSKSNSINDSTEEIDDIITEMQPNLPKKLKLHLSAQSIETQLRDMHMTPPSAVIDNINDYSNAYNGEKRDSMFTTFNEAQVIKALQPIQKGVQRYIVSNEKWTPIQYEYKEDNYNILAPKKSATNVLEHARKKKSPKAKSSKVKSPKTKSPKVNGSKKSKKSKKKSTKTRVES